MARMIANGAIPATTQIGKMAECSSGLLQNGCMQASCNTAYPHAILASPIDSSPELVIRLLKFQIWSHDFLREFKHHVGVAGLIERCIRCSQKWTHNSSYSSTMASDSTFMPCPLVSSFDSTERLKKFNDDGREDDQDQDSPDGDKDPITATPRSLSTLRFACHFHKYSPSMYCAAGCRNKTCEHPGWENIAGVKQHLQRQHIASVNSLACSVTNGRNQCDLHPENGQPLSRTESEQCDSIDLAQWQLICRLVISDRCRDENVWFEIWAILFPGTQAPAHPWHETRIQTISKPSEMSTDSTASFLTSSGTTYDHRAQTRPEIDHSPLVETTTESNAPSLLSGGSQTHSITTILPSASCGKPENTFLNSTTGFLVASSPSGMNCYRTSIPEYESPSARELGNSPGDWSQFFADLSRDDSQIFKSILNDVNHDSTRFVSNLASEYPAVSATSPHRGLEINNGLLDSSQYLENRTVSDPFSESKIALCTAWDYSVDANRLAEAKEKGSISEQNIEPEYNDKQNVLSEYLDYMDPISNTDLWTQSDSNGFESFEYWVLRDALASDPDLFARSLSLFQAEWQRKNIPRSPGVVSYATTGDATSETGAILSEANEGRQKETGRPPRKHNIPRKDPDEGDETDDEPRRKRQKQTRDSNKAYNGPRFACPFYKKDPSKYCPSATAGGIYSGDKFAHCHQYGSIELHRLVSDHFKKHKIFDCAKCCQEFDDPEAALTHSYVCPRAGQPPAQAPRRDGIDNKQLDAIKTIMKERGKKDQEKWMQIFNLLFPSTPKPPSPYCEPIVVPLTSPAVESLIRTWKILVQTECRDEKMSIAAEAFDHCVRLLRMALQTESTRADPSSFTAIPTPSSSSMVPSTPLYANERSSQASTPFLLNRSLSRVSPSTKDVTLNTPTSSSNFSGQQNAGATENLSNRLPGFSSSPWPRGERDDYTGGTFRSNWGEGALSNEGLHTRSQPQNVYIPPTQNSSVLPGESSSGFENTTPQLRNYEGSTPIEANAYMPEQPGWQNLSAQGQQLVMTSMPARSTGNQIQEQPDMVHQLASFLAQGHDLLRTVRQSIPIESTGATSSQAPSRENLMGPPTIHERSSAGHSLPSNSPSPCISGSRPISPIHEFTLPQQAQTHLRQPNPVHSSHILRPQALQREHHRLVSSQPILSTPYAIESDIYATSANQGFSNNSNNGLWQEMPPRHPPGHQFGVPTSMATDMMSNNDDLNRLLELPESNYSIDDNATSMAFGPTPNNNQNNINNNGTDLGFGRRS